MREYLHGDRTAAVDAGEMALAPGSGSVRISRAGARSLVTSARAVSPLQLLMPRNHGCGAWLNTSTYGGGLVDGDAIQLDVEVETDAIALVASRAATKAYKSPRGTSVDMTCIARAEGLLVFAPDPVVPFEGASFRQDHQFDLDDRAGLVYLDWFSSGRHAAGERWQFHRYESRLLIRRVGRLVMLDAVTLDACDGSLVERLGRFEVLLTAVVIGPALEIYADAIVSKVDGLPVGARSNLLLGVSRIAPIGCVLRAAGTAMEDVSQVVRQYLGFVPGLLGDDPWTRKR